jgi:hypothetical protein
MPLRRLFRYADDAIIDIAIIYADFRQLMPLFDVSCMMPPLFAATPLMLSYCHYFVSLMPFSLIAFRWPRCRWLIIAADASMRHFADEIDAASWLMPLRQLMIPHYFTLIFAAAYAAAASIIPCHFMLIIIIFAIFSILRLLLICLFFDIIISFRLASIRHY